MQEQTDDTHIPLLKEVSINLSEPKVEPPPPEVHRVRCSRG